VGGCRFELSASGLTIPYEISFLSLDTGNALHHGRSRGLEWVRLSCAGIRVVYSFANIDVISPNSPSVPRAGLSKFGSRPPQTSLRDLVLIFPRTYRLTRVQQAGIAILTLEIAPGQVTAPGLLLRRGTRPAARGDMAARRGDSGRGDKRRTSRPAAKR